MAFEVTIKEIEFEVIKKNLDEEVKDELNENELIIKDKGFFILDLESLIVEAIQSKDKKIGPYKILEYLEPYIKELYEYALTLKEENENENENKQ